MKKTIIADWVTEKGETGDLARSFGEILSELMARQREMREARATLHNPLSNVGKAISFSNNFETTNSLVIETVVQAVEGRCGAIFAADGDSPTPNFRLLASVAKGRIEPEEIEEGLQSYLSWAEREKRLLVLPALETDKANSLFAPPLLFAPFVIDGKLTGAFCVTRSRQKDNFSESEVRMMSKVAEHLAPAFHSFKTAKTEESTMFQTLCALSLAIEMKTPELWGHSERVANLSIAIAQEMGLGEEDLRILWDSARLHDIGKLNINPSVLLKSPPYDGGEWERLTQHPKIGEQMIRPLKSLKPLCSPIRHHHELMDGSGYPDGLKGDAHTPVLRILTAANIFDNMTTDRPGRPGLMAAEAVKILKQMAKDRKLDRSVVELLQKNVEAARVMDQPTTRQARLASR